MKKISIIGAGNVANHIAYACSGMGLQLMEVYARKHEAAEALAKPYGAKAIHSLDELSTEVDAVFLAISDDALKEVAQHLKDFPKPLIHLAASVSIEVLQSNAHASGVFYPLQTLNKDALFSWKGIPCFIEASTAVLKDDLMDLAQRLQMIPYQLNSAQRLNLHIAAVFASNFSNAMYCIADDLLKQEGIPLEVLKPLIKQTADKMQRMSPQEAQTGPAKRGDVLTLQKHLEALAEQPAYQALYQMLSEEIQKKAKK